jgi:molecular chaperone DnaJ
LTLVDIVNGVEKKIKVKKQAACKTCSGTGAKDGSSYTTCSQCHGTGSVTRIQNTILGQMQTSSTCPSCNGEGKTITEKCTTCYGEGISLQEEVVTIQIPAGVSDGMQLSVSGKGNAARRGGVNGDLIILVQEEEHEELVRDGNDLLYNLFISFPDVVLGMTAEIPTVDGKVKVKIDAGTQAGKILRLRGKGIPDINGYGKGDLLVKVNVWIPKEVNKDDKKILEAMRASDSYTPKPNNEEKSFFRKVRNFFD